VVYFFEDFTLDTARRELRQAGRIVALQPKAFDLLEYLISNRDRVVSKDDLIEEVWGGRIVSESALTTRINAARAAVGDTGEDQRLIRTFPRKGIRFVGTVREEQSAQPLIETSERTSTQLALPERPSIAVLPFANMGNDLEQEYFADGMVEEIITGLSRLRWLFVIARNSSFSYKGRSVDVKRVSRELGVRYLLEGSVRKAGNRVRIVGQLIDAVTGTHLWADHFDGTLENIFDLQDQVTAKVVSAIAPKMEQAEIQRIKHKPTENLDAYDFHLRGMANAYRWTKQSVSDALRLFYKAIEQDHDFATAYGAAAWCYYWRMVNGWMDDRGSETTEVLRLSHSAAELGGDDAVALSLGGLALGRVAGEVEAGIEMVDRALVLNPNLASAWNASGFLRTFLGDYDLAIEHLNHTMRLNPLDYLIFHTQAATALAYFLAEQDQMAWKMAEKACRLQLKLASALRIAAASNACAGRLVEAQQFLTRALEIDPNQRISNLRSRVGPFRPQDFAKYVNSLRLAGLPE
jgi:TolB-like protein